MRNNNINSADIQTDYKPAPSAVDYEFDNDLLNLITAKLLTGNIASDVINYDAFVSAIRGPNNCSYLSSITETKSSLPSTL